MICSCKDSDKSTMKNSLNSNGLDDTVKNGKIIESIQSDQIDSLTNNSSTKIFIHIMPSSNWIDSMQIINGEDGWNTVVDDNQYYIDLAKKYLTPKGYSEIDEPSEKIWKLEGKNGIIKKIDSDTIKNKWGLIIFDGINNPYFYNGTEPDEDLE